MEEIEFKDEKINKLKTALNKVKEELYKFKEFWRKLLKRFQTKVFDEKFQNIPEEKIEDNIKEVVKFENNLIYDITLKRNNAIIMLDNKIVNCNLDTSTVEEIKTFDDAQILFTSLSSNYYTIVEKSLGENETGYKIKTVRFDNTDISTTDSTNSPKILKTSGYLNYFAYQDRLQVINKWGVEIKNIDISFPPKDVVVFNKEKCVALIYSNKIYFVNM